MLQGTGPADPVFGRPLFAFDTSTDVSHLHVYRDPSTSQYVYELYSRDGGLSPGGGTNLFLSAEALPNQTFDADITLSLRTRISAAKVVFDTPAAQRAPVLAGYFAGFAILFTDPVTHAPMSLFMQIEIATSFGHRTTYHGCSGTGPRWQIIYGKSIDGDPWLPLVASNGPLQSVTFDVNRYLCDLVAQNYYCQGSTGAPQSYRLPEAAHDFRNWRLTSIYIGLETSNHFMPRRSSDSAPQGEAAVGVQLADLRVMRDPNRPIDGGSCR